MKMGIYTGFSSSTCGHGEGSPGFEFADGKWYAEQSIGYVKDDGCGGPGINKTTGREITDSQSQDELRAGLRAGTPPGADVIVFSVEGDVDYVQLSENPDLYANTKRVGHDVTPMWGSMLTEIDLASGLWMLAHNDTGNGAFFNDLDMMPIGMGEFLENKTAGNGHPAVSRAEAEAVVQTYFTMLTILKSTLLLSTRIDLLAEYHIKTVTNRDAIAIHQDDWGQQARRVSSRPAPYLPGVLRAPFGAFLALRKCNSSNPLQHWTLGGALPNRMWTTAPDGRRWCVANVNSFSQPDEVLPCDDPLYIPNASLDCSCGAGNVNTGCCHQIANVSTNLSWVTAGSGPCVGGVPTPQYCSGGIDKDVIGGMVGEGSNCALHLACEKPGEVMQAVEFADYGLLTPSDTAGSTCSFAQTEFAPNRTFCYSDPVCKCKSNLTAAKAIVAGLCVGQANCTISGNDLNDLLGDPCPGHHKRFAVRMSGCSPAKPPVVQPVATFPVQWSNDAGASGPLPHSRWMTSGYHGSSLWYWEDEPGAGNGREDSSKPRQLKPSMSSWIPRDNGLIIDDDHVGGVTTSPAKEWCAEAVGGGGLEVWAARLSGHRMAVALFNRSPSPAAVTITAHWADLGLQADAKMAVRDIWKAADVGVHARSYSAPVESRGVVYLLLTPQETAEPSLKTDDRAAAACNWPANASHIQCDMDLGRSVTGSSSPTACAEACCSNDKCAAWQWSNSSCGASAGCGCWLAHKNDGGKPTGCHANMAWSGGSRIPPDNSPPSPAPPGPSAIPPEHSLVWPQPQSQKMGSRIGYVEANAFQFTHANASAAANSKTLAAAFSRYEAVVFQHKAEPMTWVGRCDAAPCPPPPPPPERALGLQAVVVTVVSADETLALNTSERYTLTVGFPTATISADTVYGAMRGLETFAQLVQPDYSVAEQTIEDFPRFPFRAVLIDTGRHFLPVSLLQMHLDAMAYAKFNVLHWHIVDMPSFPYVSTAFPHLSASGAFDQRHIYSPADVAGVVSYAKERGIRVIPEFDVPGHTFPSWDRAAVLAGNSTLLTRCSAYDSVGGYGPLRADLESTYTFLETLYAEVAAAFPDAVLNIGGDEVSPGCYEADPEVSAFLKRKNMTGTELVAQFAKRTLGIINKLGKAPMMWRPGVGDLVPLDSVPKSAVYDVYGAMKKTPWSGVQMTANYSESATQTTRFGGQVVRSAGLYLDSECSADPDGHYGTFWGYFQGWSYYNVDPVVGEIDVAAGGRPELVIGGKANSKRSVLSHSQPVRVMFRQLN